MLLHKGIEQLDGQSRGTGLLAVYVPFYWAYRIRRKL